MKKSKMILFVVSIATISFAGSCNNNNNNNDRKIQKIFDYVFDAGTYTKLDYEYAEKFFTKNNDDWGGKCTAIAKTITNANGENEMLVGRNMDLTLSNKAAYIIRTAVPNKKKTVGLMYSHRDYAPDYKYVLEHGVPSEFDKIAPFAMDDILNEDGLYVEANMRCFEQWPDGSTKYSCHGTNEGKRRVYALSMPRYIAENCSTVDEAINYLSNLDIYTSHNPTTNAWNYGFMIADKTGARKIVEFIDDKMCVEDNGFFNINFWVNQEALDVEEYQCGLGRKDYINKRYNHIYTFDDMQQLMKDLRYFPSYDYRTCPWETCTECVGDKPNWTTEYVENNKQEIYDSCLEDLAWMEEVGEQGVRDANYIWYSIFSSVVNLTKLTFHTTFYENEAMTIDIDLNENHIINS